MRTQEVLKAINAHAAQLELIVANNAQIPTGNRTPEARAYNQIMAAYEMAVEAMDAWRQIEDLGNGNVVLETPQGEKMRYLVSCPISGRFSIERLEFA